VKLVDLNLLLYALNEDSPHHDVAHSWVEDTLAGQETVALPWVVILGFLRIVTRRGVFPRPLTPAQAAEVVDDWLQRPVVTVLRPGDEHWRILRGLLLQAGMAGNLTTDAHLAALAIEYGACLYSADGDFARFRPALRYANPLE
jgi:toxin-antitoxin system PIN domain toxin